MKKKLIVIAVTGLLVLAVLAFLCYKGYLWPDDIIASGYPVHGIDVSHYQGDIDWGHIEDNKKIRFVFIKATEGKTYQDKCFAKNWEGASKAGIYKGAYHYFTTRSPGVEQAKNFIHIVPVESGCLPPVIDIEENGVSKEVFRKNLAAYIKLIEKTYHQKPIIYTIYARYEEYLKGDFTGYPIWIRDIIKSPDLSDGRQWLFWQYSSRGRIRGVKELYDFNVFRGSMDELENLLSDGR